MTETATRTVTKTVTKTYETSAWSRDTVEAQARNMTVEVTRDHVERGHWRRFADPVSLAVNEALPEHACASVFWNSDGFRPRHAGDDARLGFYVEVTDPETGRTTEEEYWLLLPRQAERALKRLSIQGSSSFQPFRMRLAVPASAFNTRHHEPDPTS